MIIKWKKRKVQDKVQDNEWRRWFAWYPVKFDDYWTDETTIVWLRYIWRMKI